MSAGPPSPPDEVPTELANELAALNRSTLHAVRSYVSELLSSDWSPLVEDINESASGEIIDIEPHGGYAMVQKHPPKPDGSGVDRNITSLYHVQREKHPDGETSIHWAYIGDVHDTGHSTCPDCGGRMSSDADVCPHCGRVVPDD